MKSYSINNEVIIECPELTPAAIYLFFSELRGLKYYLLSREPIAIEIPPLAFRDSKLILPKDPMILYLFEDSRVQKILPPAIKNNPFFLKELTRTICYNAPVTPHPLPEFTVMKLEEEKLPISSATNIYPADDRITIIAARFPNGPWETEETQNRLSNIVKEENKSENEKKTETGEKNQKTKADLQTLASCRGALNITEILIQNLCDNKNITYEGRKEIFLKLTRQIFPPELKCKKLTLLRHYFNESEGIKELKQCIPIAEPFRQPIVDITEKIRKNADSFSTHFFKKLVHFYTLYSDSAKPANYYVERMREFKDENNSLVEFLFNPLPELHLVQLAYRNAVRTYQKNEKPNPAIKNLQQDIDSIESAKHFYANIAIFATQVANIGGPKAISTLDYLIPILKLHSPDANQKIIRNLAVAAVKYRHTPVVEFLISLLPKHNVSPCEGTAIKDCYDAAVTNGDMPLVELFFKRLLNPHLMPLPYMDVFATGNPSVLDFLFSQNKISTAIIDAAFCNAVKHSQIHASHYLKQKGAAWISIRLEAGELTYNDALESAAFHFGSLKMVQWVAEQSGIRPEENVFNKPNSTLFHKLLEIMRNLNKVRDKNDERLVDIIKYLLVKVRRELPLNEYSQLIGDLKHFAGETCIALNNLPDQEINCRVSHLTVFNNSPQTAGDSKITSFDRVESAPIFRS